MIHIIGALLDVLFPKAAAVRDIEHETPKSFLRFMVPSRVRGVVVLMPYSAPTVRAAITANKFHQHAPAAVLLGNVLLHWLHTLPPQPTTLVPLPLGRARERERGHNQVLSILQAALPTTNLAICADLLIRTRETKAQSKLDKVERRKNVAGAFAWNTRYDPTAFVGQRVILVDDVVTTGATMSAARHALRKRLTKSTTLLCVGLAH